MGKRLLFAALATIYIYSHETGKETECHDTLENCIKKVMSEHGA